MPVPQLDTRKNYIGVVNDATEQELLAEAGTRPRVMSYLVRRLAAALGRRRKAAPGRATAPREARRPKARLPT